MRCPGGDLGALSGRLGVSGLVFNWVAMAVLSRCCGSEQPARFTLVIKPVAKLLDIAVPTSMLAHADDVIEKVQSACMLRLLRFRSGRRTRQVTELLYP